MLIHATPLPLPVASSVSFTHLRCLIIKGVPKLMSVGSVESRDLGSLKDLTIDVSVEWSNGSSVAINDTVNGILEGCCNSLESLKLIGVEIGSFCFNQFNISLLLVDYN